MKNKTRGYCTTHNEAWRRHGDPLMNAVTHRQQERRKKVLRLHKSGRTTKQIATELGSNRDTILADKRALGIHITMTKPDPTPAGTLSFPNRKHTISIPLEALADLYLHATLDAQQRAEATIPNAAITRAVHYYDHLSA